MALVKCPQCSVDVSDKASSCPNCGYQLKAESMISQKALICEDCGKEIPENVATCPNCGCPIPQRAEEEMPQKVMIAGVNSTVKTSAKKLVIILLVIAVVLVGVFLAVNKIQAQKAAEEAQKAAEEAQLLEEERKAKYTETFINAAAVIAVGTSLAEEAGSLTRDVWYNAIYKKLDSRTDKFTNKIESIYRNWNDYNKALQLLFSDKDFAETLDKIKTTQDDARQCIKDLSNPPDGMEDAYDAMKAYYDAFIAFTNTVLDPTGSLLTYSGNFNSQRSAVINAQDGIILFLAY